MMTDVKRHYRDISRVLYIVLALNWLVAAAKIAYGLISRSSSMTADGFHSLADGTSNLIGLLGIYFSSQPRDEDHPYGHKKYETLFALGIAAMLFIVAFNLAREGASRIFRPVVPQVDVISFIVMLVTITVNILVMRYERNRGIALKSDILVADSMHTRADILTSLSVIAALIAVKLGLPVIDPIATLLIACFIAYSAFWIVRQEEGILCDAVAMSDTKGIEEVVLKIEGVKHCHKIRTHGRPDDIHLDLHVQVDSSMKIENSHQLSHIIKIEVIKAFPQITEVLVHVEPYK